MDRRDAIAFKIATSPVNLPKKRTLALLKFLEKKYPLNYYDIKRQIVLHFIRSNQFFDATMTLALLCIKFRETRDIELLLCITFFQDNSEFYFNDMNFFEFIEDPKEKKFLKALYDKLQQYKFIIDYERLLSNDKESHQIINNINGNCTSINEYKYHDIYMDLVHNINQGKIDKALTLSFKIFKVATYFDTIQFMVVNEKINILFKLSKKSPFFVKYYEEAVNKVTQSLLDVLEIIILTKSEVFIENFVKILKKRTNEHKKYIEGYSKDDFEL